MNILQNVSLRPYNTFGIDESAEYFSTISSTDELQEATQLPYQKRVLGGGSNILLTKPLGGLLLHNQLKGIAEEHEDDNFIWLRVQSGEIWHELVLYAIARNLGGIENLALIPGTVGAAPMQNIGAYGVEAKETIQSVECWLWDERTMQTIPAADCRFGYRDSIFKHELKDKVFITSVVLKLSKRPVFNTSYGAITQELEAMGASELSVANIAQAVMNIRSSKLPDPRKIGNAGSFFKNPTVSVTNYRSLRYTNPEMPCYTVDEDHVKIPAAWLIEQCGWKGYRAGDAGVHTKQALVLVNYGSAPGSELWQLSSRILESVHARFGITLEREVQVW